MGVCLDHETLVFMSCTKESGLLYMCFKSDLGCQKLSCAMLIWIFMCRMGFIWFMVEECEIRCVFDWC